MSRADLFNIPAEEKKKVETHEEVTKAQRKVVVQKLSEMKREDEQKRKGEAET